MANEVTVPLLPCRSIDEIVAFYCVLGFSRMTRPRKRKNADNLTGFAVIDPGGSWIRVTAANAELATRADDRATATDAIRRARRIRLTHAERAEIGETLASLIDLETVIRASNQLRA